MAGRIAYRARPSAHNAGLMRLDRTTRRSKEQVTSQWQLFRTVWNLHKLYRYGESFV